MKNISLYLTAFLLLFASCDKGCKIKYPKDVKPIDWENYNDVHTVYWNTIHCCSEIIDLQENAIKITGWKIQSRDLFALGDDAKCAESLFVPSPSTVVYINLNFPEAYAFLDTCDLTKKCFIKGKIRLEKDKTRSYCSVEPKIEVIDISDIYFE